MNTMIKASKLEGKKRNNAIAIETSLFTMAFNYKKAKNEFGYISMVYPVYIKHDIFTSTNSSYLLFQSSTGSGKTRCAPFFFSSRIVFEGYKRPFFIMTQPSTAIAKMKSIDLKPIIKESLYDTLDDILDTFHKESNDTYIIKNNSGIHKIYLSDIMYAEALNRKVILYLSDNEQVMSTDVFSSLCDTLMTHKEFALPHRSFIVNMNYIKTIDTVRIELTNSKTIPVAQRRVSDIKKQYLDFQMEE